MAKNTGGFFQTPWFYHYELFEREDGWWNAIIFAQGSFPVAMCEAETRLEAECRAFNALIYISKKDGM